MRAQKSVGAPEIEPVRILITAFVFIASVTALHITGKLVFPML